MNAAARDRPTPTCLPGLLIAKLLKDGMHSIENMRAGEEFQFNEALNSSVLVDNAVPTSIFSFFS